LIKYEVREPGFCNEWNWGSLLTRLLALKKQKVIDSVTLGEDT